VKNLWALGHGEKAFSAFGGWWCAGLLSATFYLQEWAESVYSIFPIAFFFAELIISKMVLIFHHAILGRHTENRFVHQRGSKIYVAFQHLDQIVHFCD